MDPNRMRDIQRRIRESHRKLVAVQGVTIVALREALDAVSQTHDEMAKLFEADDDPEAGCDR